MKKIKIYCKNQEKTKYETILINEEGIGRVIYKGKSHAAAVNSAEIAQYSLNAFGYEIAIEDISSF